MESPTYELKSDANIWVVRAGEGGQYTSEFEAGDFAAIGYFPVGNVEGLERKKITEIVASVRPGKKEKSLERLVFSTDSPRKFRLATLSSRQTEERASCSSARLLARTSTERRPPSPIFGMCGR